MDAIRTRLSRTNTCSGSAARLFALGLCMAAMAIAWAPRSAAEESKVKAPEIDVFDMRDEPLDAVRKRAKEEKKLIFLEFFLKG